MIGRLRGTLVEKQPPLLLIDVQGVGYEVEAPMSTCLELPAIGVEVSILTHLSVREDAHILFGFRTAAERELFRTLLKVSGIGAKLALAVLSAMSVNGFKQCVQDRDVTALTKIPGVGKKTAERICVELVDRLGPASGLDTSVASMQSNSSPKAEAHSALVALGYKPIEVERLLQRIDSEGASSEELIRRALQGAMK